MSVGEKEAADTIYECLECHKFFTRMFVKMSWLRDVPMEEVTARRLRGERIYGFICGECGSKLLTGTRNGA